MAFCAKPVAAKVAVVVVEIALAAVLSPVKIAAVVGVVAEFSGRSGEPMNSASSCGWSLFGKSNRVWNSRDCRPLTGVMGSFADSLSVSSSSSGMGPVRSVG